MPSNDLLALIKSKQDEIAKLQSELDEATRLLLGKDQASRHADRRVASAVPERPKRSHHKKRPPQQPARKIPETSSVGRAVELMRQHGEMHIDQILREIQERFHQRVLKDTLVGNLSRYVKAGDVFYRAAPSVYGLIEQRDREKHAKAG